MAKNPAGLSLQQPARLYGEDTERHLQFVDGRGKFGMLSDLVLQGLQNLMSTRKMCCRLRGIRLGIQFALVCHGPSLYFCSQFYQARTSKRVHVPWRFTFPSRQGKLGRADVPKNTTIIS